MKFAPLLLLAACVSTLPAIAPPPGEVATVFVHGYQGAQLVTDTGAVAWLTPGAVLSSGHENLAMGFEGQRAPPTYLTLKPSGPLSRITIFPFIASRDFYFSWVNYGREHLPGFVPFAYDWRQDVRTSGAELCAFLEKLPAGKVNVIAHSMGGIVTLSCLAQKPELLARVQNLVFAGTPFKGAPGIFDDLLNGSVTGRNRALLSRDALLSFTAPWQLLPATPDFFIDTNGAPVKFDVFSADTWVAQRWGMAGDQPSAGELAKLARNLEAHHALRAQLDAPVLSPMPKVLGIIGHGRPTVNSVRVLNGRVDFGEEPRADGDGSVPVWSAVPPFAFEKLETGAEHTALLNDADVREQIRIFLGGTP